MMAVVIDLLRAPLVLAINETENAFENKFQRDVALGCVHNLC